MVTYIGWIAMLGTLASFWFRDASKLRLVNAAACSVWIVYAVARVDYPIIAINLAVILTHLYWFYEMLNPKAPKVQEAVEVESSRQKSVDEFIKTSLSDKKRVQHLGGIKQADKKTVRKWIAEKRTAIQNKLDNIIPKKTIF
jgi:hypothetical protein